MDILNKESIACANIKPAFRYNNIPIVFVTDENYLPYLKVVINSILKNTSARNLDVLIFHDSLPEEIQNKFIFSISNHTNLSIRFVNINTYVNATQVNAFNKKKHISVASLYKLFVPYVLTEFEKVLYLDIDLIVCSNVGSLFDIDLEDNLIGAVRDISFTKIILKQSGYIDFAKKYDFNETDTYVNAGVILFNCLKFREQNTFPINKLVDIAVDASGFYADQDAINFCCKDKIKIISSEWNFLAIKGRVNEFKELISETINIIHFAGSFKPWVDVENILVHHWWNYVNINDGKELWRKIFNNENEIAIGNDICVSVVIPIYNAEQYLYMMLISLISQTLTNIEILCIDDGSKDYSKIICDEFKKFDSRIKVISQPNSGAAVARNRGLDEAQGKWIIFVDADDFCKPNMLEKMVQKGEADQSDIVVAGRNIIDVQNDYKYENPLPKSCVQNTVGNCHSSGINIFSSFGTTTWNKLCCKSFVLNKKIGFHQTPPNDDAFFVLTALIHANKISFEDSNFYYYRSNLSTSQLGNNDKYPINFLVALLEVRNQIPVDDFILQKQFYSVAIQRCFYNLFSRKTIEGMEETFNAIQKYGLESLRFPHIKDNDLDLGIYKTAYEYTNRGESLLCVLNVQSRLIANQVKKLGYTLSKKNTRINELLGSLREIRDVVANKDAKLKELYGSLREIRDVVANKDAKLKELYGSLREIRNVVANKDKQINKLKIRNEVLQKSRKRWQKISIVLAACVVALFFFGVFFVVK